MIITPKDWREFQHYKDRSPPWIRLHKKLLDNYEFHCLPVASRALAPMLWLLASDSIEGQIDAAPEKLAFRLRMTVREVSDALKPLIDKGFFTVEQGDSSVLAKRERGAVPETEAETEASQSLAERFEAFWQAYPRKVSKQDAVNAWAKLKPSAAMLERMVEAIAAQRKSDQWQRDKGRFIPYPATWLNGERWADEAAIEVAADAGGETVAEYQARMASERAEEAARMAASKGIPAAVQALRSRKPPEAQAA